MQTIINIIAIHVLFALDALLDFAILDTLDLLAPAPSDLTHIDRVCNDLRDC